MIMWLVIKLHAIWMGVIKTLTLLEQPLPNIGRLFVPMIVLIKKNWEAYWLESIYIIFTYKLKLEDFNLLAWFL